MSTPFANTLRSLNADRYNASLIVVGVAVALLIAWGSWFFFARITIYEVSASAEFAGDGFVIADFPAAKSGRIRRGQAAWLYPVQDGAKLPGSVTAVVTDIIRSPSTEPARVKLYTEVDRDLSEIFPEDQKVGVEIEVEICFALSVGFPYVWVFRRDPRGCTESTASTGPLKL